MSIDDPSSADLLGKLGSNCTDRIFVQNSGIGISTRNRVYTRFFEFTKNSSVMTVPPVDAFLTSVNKICAGSDTAHPLIGNANRVMFIDALEAVGMITWDYVSAFNGGVFSLGTASPSDNTDFARKLAAAKDTAGAVIVAHTPLLDVFVVALAAACRKRAVALAGPRPGDPVPKAGAAALDKDEQDRLTTKNCYTQYEMLTGKHVPLTDRATFVGAARNHLNADGHIATIPPPDRVTYLGVSSGPSSTTVGNVTMQIGDGVQSPKCGTPEECKHRTRTLVWALGAVLCVEISATHYGGGNDGYILVPGGGSKRIRLAITQAALDKLCDALLSIPAEDTTRNFATVAHIFNRFLNLYAEGNMHPCSLINQIVTQERQLFVLRGTPPPADSDGASSTVSSVAPSDSASQQGSAANNGVCMSWLNNGGCNLTDCALNHPARMRGMAHGGNGSYVANGSGTKRRNNNSNQGGGGGWWDGNNNRNQNGGNNGNRSNSNGGGNNGNNGNGNGNGNRNNNNGHRSSRGNNNNNGNGGGNGGGGGGGRDRGSNRGGNGRN